MIAKELKEILNTVPDETPIVVFKSNMEGSGYSEEYVSVSLREMVRVKETRIDAFDHVTYTANVLKDSMGWDVPKVQVLVID